MLRNLSLLILLLLHGAAIAETLDEVLGMSEKPAGVVIEVVEGDEAALEERLKEFKTMLAKLEAKYPGMPIAIVSHGAEQFSLTREQANVYPAIHGEIQSLVERDINVHVCGAHAGWYEVTAEDYPDYVDVSPSGPAQIRDYLALGYVQIVF